MVENLLSIGLLIVVAKLAEGVFRRLGLSPILAYTVTGIVLGPVIIGWVAPVPELQVFLGVGIFILFFMIGLDEIDVPAFVATISGRFFVAALLSVVVCTAISLIVTSDLLGLDFSLNLDLNEALAVAGVLSLSSVGLVAKVLADSGNLREPIGLEIFTTTIIAELIAILIVGFTIEGHGRPNSVVTIFTLLGKIAGFSLVVWVLSSRLLPPAIAHVQRFLKTPELSFGILIGGLLLVVVAAETLHFHGTIGALLFGAALSGLPREVRRDVMPGIRSTAEGLFVPLFFASAGLHLDLSFLDLPALTVVALVTIPLVGKFTGAFLGAFAAVLDKPYAQAWGLMAKGVAEIALLVVLLELNVIGQEVFSLLVLVMFGYILLMPPAITYAVNRAKLSHHARPQMMPPSFARHALDSVRVYHVLDRTGEYTNSSVSVQEFHDRWVTPHQDDYVVVDDGIVAGIVSAARLRFLRRGAWAATPIRNVMSHQVSHAVPDEAIEDVLKRMADHSLDVIPVMDQESGEFLGTVTSGNILELITFMDEIATELKNVEGRPRGATGDD